MHGRYVTDILKMCMKKSNKEKKCFGQIYRVLICILRGYTESLACSQFLVIAVKVLHIGHTVAIAACMSFLCYFRSAISYHLLIVISISHEWMVN